MRVLLGQPAIEPVPARAGVASSPDRRVPVRHRAPVAGIERDHVERVAVVRVNGGGEAELRWQPFGDLRPGVALVVAAMHADVVLLEHPLPVRRRAHELVDAESDVFVRARPVGPEAAVPRRP